MNAYKQIDMYKSVITSLKAKEISIESLDKYNLSPIQNQSSLEQSQILGEHH